MSHELSFNFAGKAEMAYIGAKPWHGMGQEVSPGASLEQWLSEARMDWEINRAPVQFTSNGAIHTFNDNHVLFRSDNNVPLSVVSPRYKVVQPKEMIEFFRSLVEREGFSIETLGSLKEGRRIWALAKTSIENDVLGSDRLKAYVLLITSCDGSLATTAKFVSTRVVCWNTQTIALGEDGQQVKVRHNTVFDPNAVKGKMGLIGSKAFDHFLGQMRDLTKVKISQNDAKSIVSSLLPVPTGEKEIEQSRGFVKIMGLFNGSAKGSNLPGVSGTAWGLLNAITEYSDHHSRAHNAENRLFSQWFGANANLKDAAESQLVAMI
jgi:phage/plasmid-like protein (TIGR03299 family)